MMLMVRSVIQFGWGVQLRSLQPGVIQQSQVLLDALRISPKHVLIIASALVLDAPGPLVADPH